MFATLKYGTNDAVAELIERAYRPPTGGRDHYHTACDSCRAQKLKCNGPRTGCDRCSKKGLTCNFSADNRSGPKSAKSRFNLESSASSQATKVRTMKRHADSISIKKTTTKTEKTSVASTCQQNIPKPNQPSGAELLPIISESEAAGPLADDFAIVPENRTVTLEENMVGPEQSEDSYCPSSPPYSLGDFLIEDFNISPRSPEAVLLNTSEHDCDDKVRPASPSPFMTTSFTPEFLEKARFDTESLNQSPPQRQRSSEEQDILSISEKLYPTPIPYSPPAVTTPPPTFCHCMQRALRALDSLESALGYLEIHTADQLLTHQKNALWVCASVIECKTCSRRSASITLLVVVCGEILTLLEQLAQQQQAGAGAMGDGGQRASSDFEIAQAGGSVRLGSYEIDSPREWYWVLRTAGLLQLRRLTEILRVLKTVAIESMWDTVLSILSSFDKRLGEVSSQLENGPVS